MKTLYKIWKIEQNNNNFNNNTPLEKQGEKFEKNYINRNAFLIDTYVMTKVVA